MNHLNEGMLQGFLDQQLSATERTAVQRHLASCADCMDELETLRAASARLAGALSLLDSPSSLADARAALRSRADTGGVIPIQRGRWDGIRPALTRAAILVVGLAAVASATIPGSPVRELIASGLERAAELFGSDEAPPAPAVTPAPQPAPVSGVAIEPLAGEVRIVLLSLAPESRVRVTLVDGSRAAVQATGDASSARFRTGPGRIEVVGGGVGELRVELPKALSAASVEVNGKPYLYLQGTTLRVVAPQADTLGADLLFRIKE